MFRSLFTAFGPLAATDGGQQAVGALDVSRSLLDGAARRRLRLPSFLEGFLHFLRRVFHTRCLLTGGHRGSVNVLAAAFRRAFGFDQNSQRP